MPFAPKHWLSAKQVINCGPGGFHEVWRRGQRHAGWEVDVGPSLFGSMIDRSPYGGPCA
jgi:hypothetical protein